MIILTSTFSTRIKMYASNLFKTLDINQNLHTSLTMKTPSLMREKWRKVERGIFWFLPPLNISVLLIKNAKLNRLNIKLVYKLMAKILKKNVYLRSTQDTFTKSFHHPKTSYLYLEVGNRKKDLQLLCRR